MKTKNFIICSTLMIALSACVTTVPISTTDTILPKVSIITASDGNLASSTGDPVQESVLQGSEVGFMSIGNDDLGIKSLRFSVLEGGKMKVNDEIKADTLLENVITENTSKNSLAIGGSLVFDTPSSEMRLQAVTEDWAGNVAAIQTYILVQVPGPEARISANREVINRGESVTLTYETENADAVFLNGDLLSTRNGTKMVSPNVTTDYILKSTSYVGQAQGTVRVTVNQPASAPQILNFSSNKYDVQTGESFNLQWNCINTSSILIRANGVDFNTNNAQGNLDRTINTPGRYDIVLLATGPGGSVSKQFTITVRSPEPIVSCIRTNCMDGGLYCFTHEQTISGSSSWALAWNFFTTTKRITTIKNNMDRVVLLIWGEGNDQVLSLIQAGQTIEAPFRGKSLAKFYRAAVDNNPDGDLPPGIDLTFCFE